MTHRPALHLSLFLLFIYLLSYSGLYHAVDELSALAVTETILAAGQVHVNQMAWDQTRTPPQNAPGVDGKLYSKKGVGVSLAALPLFALGKAWDGVGAVQVTLLLNPLLTALLVYVFYHLVLILDYSSQVARLGALALGLGTLAWPYSRTLFSETLAMLGIGLALYGVLAFRRTAGQSSGAQPLLLAGSGVGLALLAKPANGLILLAVGLYLVYAVGWERRANLHWPQLLHQAISFGAPLLIAGGGTLLYNYLRFHTLLTFPLEPFERFDTPLTVGLAGLLFGPGKGLLWYVPLVWLIVPGLWHWRTARRLPDHLLAAGMMLSLLLLYAQWYDWPGGRAWGPRMIVMIMPALVLLALPVIDQWSQPAAHRWQRYTLGFILIFTCLVQLPGVLVNFERQEGLDMQAGITFTQLLWDWQHSPLLTYWQAIGSRASDPLLLQPFFWQQPWWQTGSLVLLGGVIIGGLSRQTWPHWQIGLMIGLLGCFAVGLVFLAQADPRWRELSADEADNVALMQTLAAAAKADELVLLDLLPQNDFQGRAWWWMNRTPSLPGYVGWMRTATNDPLLEQRLQPWLLPRDRIWLALQNTNEFAPDSTTEHWLDRWAYRGRQQWIGSQRLVEYLTPTASQLVPLSSGSFVFSDTLTLASYRYQPGQRADLHLIELTWGEPLPAADLRFSVQALNEQGQLVAQLDRTPGQLGSAVDRVGLATAAAAVTVILKVYRASDGGGLPVRLPDGQVAEYMVLK